MAKRKTTHDLQKLYRADTPITMVTCYDYTFARLVQKVDIDTILIGDSLGNVVQGRQTTLPVTVDDIIYHTRAVLRGNHSALVIADMPFMSYQASFEEGMRNAGRLLKEGCAQAVKVEGGQAIAPLVEQMVYHGIPVVGHLGFTPQSVHKFGGYRVQGRSDEAASQLVTDAKALQDAGAFMIVLEMVPKEAARKVTEALEIPTIGIGAGNATSGQVLVLQDLLGMNQDFKPTFVKNFANLEKTVTDALSAYRDEVRSRAYPGDEHSFD
jgi:3-methyl-2-oxobutanoate hydroxymethyltransferase